MKSVSILAKVLKKSYIVFIKSWYQETYFLDFLFPCTRYRSRILSQKCTHICELFEFMRLGISTYKWCILLALQKSPVAEKISLLLVNTHFISLCRGLYLSAEFIHFLPLPFPRFLTLRCLIPFAVPTFALQQQRRQRFLLLSFVRSFFSNETTLCHYICNSNVESSLWWLFCKTTRMQFNLTYWRKGRTSTACDIYI